MLIQLLQCNQWERRVSRAMLDTPESVIELQRTSFRNFFSMRFDMYGAEGALGVIRLHDRELVNS